MAKASKISEAAFLGDVRAPVDRRQRAVARPPVIVQAGQIRKPDRKIDILALMQQLDPEAPVWLGAREFACQGTGDAAEQRHTLHLGERHEARRNGVGRSPECLLPEE